MRQDVNDLALEIVAALQARLPSLDFGGLAPDLAKALRSEGARDGLAAARRAALLARVAGCSRTSRYLGHDEARGSSTEEDGKGSSTAGGVAFVVPVPPGRTRPRGPRGRGERRARPDRQAKARFSVDGHPAGR